MFLSLDVLSGAPYAALAELRSSAPVSYVESLGGWLVTGYDAAVHVMRDAETFTVDDPRFTTGRVIGPSMLSLDGSEHERHRTPFVAPYRRRAMADLGERIAARARQLVRGFAPMRRGELRTELAGPLAAESVLMTLELGAEPGDALAWYRSIVAAVTSLSAGRDMPEEGPAAFDQLAAVVANIPSKTSELVAAARRSLSDREVAANVAVVMFGGIETTEGAIANLLWHLLSSGELDAVRRDRRRLPSVIEESLRLEPAAARVDRYATQSVQLAGASISAGDLVIVSLTAANRDPAVFDDPDTFRPHRHNAGKHLTFARGPHNCLGSHLARIEMNAAFDALLTGLPDIRLAAEASTPPSGLVFRKPQRIVAEWNARD